MSAPTMFIGSILFMKSPYTLSVMVTPQALILVEYERK